MLLRCVDLLEDLDDGRILLDGDDISDPRLGARATAKVQRWMAIVFQEYNLFPHMTARQNVALAPRVVHGLTPDEADERAAEQLHRVVLESLAGTYPDRLELGFAKQASDRVCILDRGRVVESGPPGQVLGDPVHTRTQEYLARVIAAGRLV